MLCVACARRCACSDVCALRSGCGCAGRRAGVQGLCFCVLCVSVRDASGCSCIFIASPAPPRTLCLRAGVCRRPDARGCVCLLYVSSVKHRHVAVLHVFPLRRSLAVCRCFDVVVVVVVVVCRALVRTCMASLCVALLLARASQCRWFAWWDDGVRYLWAVWLCRFGVTRTRCCA